jgi:hypothetical protein
MEGLTSLATPLCRSWLSRNSRLVQSEEWAQPTAEHSEIVAMNAKITNLNKQLTQKPKTSPRQEGKQGQKRQIQGIRTKEEARTTNLAVSHHRPGSSNHPNLARLASRSRKARLIIGVPIMLKKACGSDPEPQIMQPKDELLR